MVDGFEIKILESDFKAKPESEQNWILFQGVSSVKQCIDKLDIYGCKWGQKRYEATTLKVIGTISSGVMIGLGFIYILYKLIVG